MTPKKAVDAVTAVWTPKLLRPKYQKKVEDGASPLTGSSYIFCEAVWHLSDQKKSGLKLHMLTAADSDGEVLYHFYFLNEAGRVLDPTASQFERKLDYSAGKPQPFMSIQPSPRARTLINRALENVS